MEKNLRDPISSITHLVSAGIALPAIVALIALKGTSPTGALALTIYGLSLIAMFLASGIYHAVQSPPPKVRLLRQLDHAAIYLLIAGTYTPFCLLAFDGFWKWGLLGLIWTLALSGIVIKVYTLHSPRWITAGLYILMGWLSVFAVQEMLLRLAPETIIWLLVGGLTYTAGAVVYITRRLNFFPGRFGFHEVWHLFVIGGAAAHFAAVASLV